VVDLFSNYVTRFFYDIMPFLIKHMKNIVQCITKNNLSIIEKPMYHDKFI
jgi:hypothetical protein